MARGQNATNTVEWDRRRKRRRRTGRCKNEYKCVQMFALQRLLQDCVMRRDLLVFKSSSRPHLHLSVA